MIMLVTMGQTGQIPTPTSSQSRHSSHLLLDTNDRRSPYLACISSSSPVASTDHVRCDISIKWITAVTSCSWNNGHSDRPQDETGLVFTQPAVAPPRHPTHPAFNYTRPLPGKRHQRHIFVQHHGGPQLHRKSGQVLREYVTVSANSKYLDIY